MEEGSEREMLEERIADFKCLNTSSVIVSKKVDELWKKTRDKNECFDLF